MQEEIGVKQTIAVFDDDQDLLEIFRFLFEEEGYRTVLHKSCDDVVAKVRDLQPCLILMDNWIPVLGGEAAIAQLRSEEDLQHIPIYFGVCQQ